MSVILLPVCPFSRLPFRTLKFVTQQIHIQIQSCKNKKQHEIHAEMCIPMKFKLVMLYTKQKHVGRAGGRSYNVERELMLELYILIPRTVFLILIIVQRCVIENILNENSVSILLEFTVVVEKSVFIKCSICAYPFSLTRTSPHSLKKKGPP